MNKNFKNITFILSFGYVLIITFFLIWHRVGFSPDQFFAIALLITLFVGRLKQFLHDWSMPVTLFLSYDYLRGLVPKLSLKAHIFPMIDFDKTLFGAVPTNILQSKLFSKDTIHWYDYMATIFYMSHFVVPMIVGFFFWFKDKKYFQQYITALLILSYGAFITYVLFPAMPPWMAAQQGFIPEVFKVNDRVFASFATPIDLPSVYRFVGANLVAAVPSLHAAYPLLTFLFIKRKYKRFGWLLLPYVLGVWFSIVYLGEHYVFDIMVGVIYAILSYLLVVRGRRIFAKINLGKMEKIYKVKKIFYSFF